MARLEHVQIPPRSVDPFRELLGERWAEVEAGIREARRVFAGRAVWNVNSTARGGGVAELLRSLLAYARAVGVDTRWAVIGGEEEFFTVTKRIHNNLHGFDGDGGELGEAERATYESVLASNAAELVELVRPHDVVLLHDPQTAGLVPLLSGTGARIIWRCHVGLDLPNDQARRAWEFLSPYVLEADAYVFSRREFAWEGLDEEKVWVVHPSIDAFSPKNQDLQAEAAMAILAHTGITADGTDAMPAFTREDGTPGRVDRHAELLGGTPVPGGAPLVAQVSRWDRLKDHPGVLAGLAPHLAGRSFHLVLAGPSTAAVADDPEGAAELENVLGRWRDLPGELRERVQVTSLPMDDVEENAAIVNALQRRASVVVQKSLAEGFGLTVAEAMWKARPVVATRTGGIQEQIDDGVSGILLDDPLDLVAFGDAVAGLLDDRDRRTRMGAAARQRAFDRFLGTRHLLDYLALVAAGDRRSAEG